MSWFNFNKKKTNEENNIEFKLDSSKIKNILENENIDPDTAEQAGQPRRRGLVSSPGHHHRAAAVEGPGSNRHGGRNRHECGQA